MSEANDWRVLHDDLVDTAWALRRHPRRAQVLRKARSLDRRVRRLDPELVRTFRMQPAIDLFYRAFRPTEDHE